MPAWWLRLFTHLGLRCWCEPSVIAGCFNSDFGASPAELLERWLCGTEVLLSFGY